MINISAASVVTAQCDANNRSAIGRHSAQPRVSREKVRNASPVIPLGNLKTLNPLPQLNRRAVIANGKFSRFDVIAHLRLGTGNRLPASMTCFANPSELASDISNSRLAKKLETTTTSNIPMRSGKFFLIAAAGLVSAVFAYFGTGLHPIWWALWLAPIPVLAISPRLGGGAAFLVAAFAWVIGEMNQWNYVRHQIELPAQITILYFVVPAVVFGLGVLFVRGFVRRGSLFLASLALPVYWVAYEYLTAIASPHSTWGNLAYTQMNCLAVIQIAAITGLWGISFVVFLFAGAVAALLSGAGKRWQRRALAVAVGFVVCAVFVFGKWRLQSNPPGIDCSDIHRQGRADECLSRLRRASIEVVE